MTRTEKIILGIILLMILICGINIYKLNTLVTNEGGLKEVIISIGKDVKDVKQEIEKH